MTDNVKIITYFVDIKTGKVAPTVWVDALPPRAGDRTCIELASGSRWSVDCGAAVVSFERIDGERCQVFLVNYKPVRRIVDAEADSIVGEG